MYPTPKNIRYVDRDGNSNLLKETNYFNLPKFRQWWEKQYSDGDYAIVTEIDAGARADY